MAEPSEKSPAIDALLSLMTGKDRKVTIRAGLCMTCDKEAKVFDDKLSEQEYAISGMCQVCQNEAFGG